MAERSLQPFYPELSRIGTETRLGAGAMLWHEGDPGDSVVLVLDGTLEVLLEAGDESEEVILRTLDAGALVGELASTDGRPRSAAVRARSPCRILKIPAPDFRILLRRCPDMLEELYWLQMERVRSLTRQVTKTHQQAITDVLTRLYNYGFFRERLEIELERARQTGDLISLVIFDIDHFKHYNDTNGHSEGNVVLVQVSAILKNAGRRGDIPARYGGEELVALLYGATREEAARFAEHVRQNVEAYAFKGGSTQPLGKVTVSAGVATYPWDATGDAALIKAADQNLYKAKEAGRNRVVTNEPEPA
ncbi:MAG: GGDEF domain-containing protein [Gammaproteobacteria bacterium]